jgi:phosphoribosylformimino-5-aminoimidazole carboxamide ribotide isomerase
VTTAMRIIAVLDVMHGEVVRGVGGRRCEYRPIVSRLTPSSRPLEVAKALAAHLGCRELYIADLDAIGSGEPAWPLYAALRRQGFQLWVDAGIRRRTRAYQLAEAGIESIVAGLETLAGPAELAAMAQALGERLVFSLDLYQGQPLGAWRAECVNTPVGRAEGVNTPVGRAEGVNTPVERAEGVNTPVGRAECVNTLVSAENIAAQAVRLGVRRLLVLDLARVGCAGGTGTRELCARLCAKYPQVSVSAGGGVRHRGDLYELQQCGVQAVLVASALHDGRITRADFQGL